MNSNPIELSEQLRRMPGAQVHRFVSVVDTGYQHLQGNARPLIALADAFKGPDAILKTFNVKARALSDRVLLEHERLFHNYLATASSFTGQVQSHLMRLRKQDSRWAVVSPYLKRLDEADICRFMRQLRNYAMHPQALTCLVNMELRPNEMKATFTLSPEQLRSLGQQDRKPMTSCYWSYVDRNAPLVDLTNEHLDEVETFIASITEPINSTFAEETKAYAEAAEEIRAIVLKDFPDLAD